MNNIEQITTISSPCRNYCQQVGRCLLSDIATGRADIDVLRSAEIPRFQNIAEQTQNPAWRQTFGDLIDTANQEVMDELNSPFADTIDQDGVQETRRIEQFEIVVDHPIFGNCETKTDIGTFGVGIIVTTDSVSGVIDEEFIALDTQGNELRLSGISSENIESWHKDYITRATYIDGEALQSIRRIRDDIVVNQYNWIESESERGSIETYIRPIESDAVRNDGDIWDNVLEIHEFFTVRGENNFNEVDNEKFIVHSIFLGHRYRDADLSDIDTAEFDEDSNWLSLGVKGEQDSCEIMFESREEMQKFIELAVEMADVEQRSEEFFITLRNQASLHGVVIKAKDLDF